MSTEQRLKLHRKAMRHMDNAAKMLSEKGNKEEGFDTARGGRPPATRGTRRRSASFKKKKFPLLFPFENGAEARRHELVNSLHF